MAEVVVQHQDLLQVQEIVGDSVPDPTSAVVGGETRASSGAGNGLLVADGSGEEGVRNDRAAASCLAPQVVEKEGNEKANQEGEGRLRRSLSPEYVDAVQDPELQQNTMGETATRKDTDEVEGSNCDGVQRHVLLRDPNYSSSSSSSDLGIGVRVAGGVRCKKCGQLHAVITDISGNLPSGTKLCKGLAVLEWCGNSIDGASYEEVRSVMAATEERTEIELSVKECRGPPPQAKHDIPTTIQPSTSLTGIKINSQVTDIRQSPSHSPTDREASYTPKSLSPSPSPVRSRTCTPTHSASTTPSPTPPPSPNLHRRGVSKKQILDPRPASINFPLTATQTEVVAPKFMVNGVPTSPPNEKVQSSKNLTVENIVGEVPAASIHMSLRYREDERHLRILLHEVKQTKKKKKKKNVNGSPSRSSAATAQGHFFINSYLVPDLDNQGVRSCEVLSHVSDLENPQFYTINREQLVSVALRVVLFEVKNSKHPNFIGEVLMALSDKNAVRLEGHPSWFTMCKSDPNLPPPPSATLVKRTRKKEDIFYRVRRGTGYALQSLRRPMSMGVEALAAENGHISSSSSVDDSLETSIKRLQAAHVTMPRRVKKERKALSGLFTSPQHTASPTATVAMTTTTNDGADPVKGRELPGDFFNDNGAASSLSVPTSPLISRKAPKENGTLARRKKLGGILQVLRSSLLSTSHGNDHNSPRRKRAVTGAGEDSTDGLGDGGDVTEGGRGDKKRRWSLSGDVKHRILPMSPPPHASPFSASSSPFTSPQHGMRRQPLVGGAPSSPKPDSAHRRVHSALADYKLFSRTDSPPESNEMDYKKGGSTGDLLAPDVTSSVLLSDGSWYSAEEDVVPKHTESNPQRTNKNKIASSKTKMTRNSNSASKLLYSRAYTIDNGLAPPHTQDAVVGKTVKGKSRSVEDLLDSQRGEVNDRRGGGGGGGGGKRLHRPVKRTDRSPFTPGSSGSSFEDDYATANSRPSSAASESGDDRGGEGGGEDMTQEESSLDISTRIKAIGRVNAISLSPKFRAVSPTTAAEGGGHISSMDEGVSEERISKWRSFEDLLGALPLQKRKPKWLKRTRTHHVSSSSSSSPSPLLKRRSSEPSISLSPPVGSARLELTYNPDTSMVGIRLHEHTLSDHASDLRVQTYLYSRVGVANQEETHHKMVSFKKTDYSHTLVACFTCDSSIADLSLQVSLEASGRFFSRPCGHVVLDLGPLLLPAESHSVTRWFPLFQTPCYPPNNAHHFVQQKEEMQQQQ